MEVIIKPEYENGKIVIRLDDWQYQDIKNGIKTLYQIRDNSCKNYRSKSNNDELSSRPKKQRIKLGEIFTSAPPITLAVTLPTLIPQVPTPMITLVRKS